MCEKIDKIEICEIKGKAESTVNSNKLISLRLYESKLLVLCVANVAHNVAAFHFRLFYKYLDMFTSFGCFGTLNSSTSLLCGTGSNALGTPR